MKILFISNLYYNMVQSTRRAHWLGGDCLLTRTHELAELSLQACLKTHSYHSAPQFTRQQTTAKEFNCTITWKNWCNHFQKILYIWGTFRQVLKIYICVQPISKCKNVSNVAFGLSYLPGSIKLFYKFYEFYSNINYFIILWIIIFILRIVQELTFFPPKIYYRKYCSA